MILTDSLPGELERHARALAAGVDPKDIAVALLTMATDLRTDAESKAMAIEHLAMGELTARALGCERLMVMRSDLVTALGLDVRDDE